MGFGGGYDADYEDSPEQQENAPAVAAIGSGSREGTSPAEPAATEDANLDELTLSMFTTVVEVFNQALPSFLREAVDPEAQKRFIYTRLENSVKEQLQLMSVQAKEKCEASWQQRQVALRAEVETIKEKLRQSEERQNEARQAQLSAERQKRALSERVHDLESKVIQLEAEQEQIELEKKSMLNKLKVASVHEDDSAALREEVQRLKKELEAKSAEKTPASPVAEVAAVAEVVQTGVPQEDYDRLMAENESLKRSLAMTGEELESTREALDNANEDLKMAVELQAQMEKFEDVKKRQDSRINSLKKKNSELNSIVAELKAEVERLTPQPPAAEAPEPAPQAEAPQEAPETPAEEEQKDVQIFDGAFDETTWVVENVEHEEPRDFGYKPPRKKAAPPADDATHQLSLW